ncbi:MAG: DUF92 domain-containing protein [Acholeplasmataceae bacterium]|jgi:uncharacterized protein (TIGR00297 family)|nr:DUF92 domain-containing protein [Acholeplasmataceae bacterium]
MLVDIIIGLGLSLIIAFLAYKKKSLDLSGFLGAILFGTLIYIFGSYVVWSILISFFISSSLLTKLHEKKDQERSEGRNIVQVISNAMIATVFSILYYVTKESFFMLAAVVSIAASNADTWASEIGILSKGKTYYITNFKVAPKGASGAITVLGTLASFIGALFIAIIFVTLYGLVTPLTPIEIVSYGFIVTISGFLGCQIDSLLGALLQAKYKGVNSGVITEKKWLPNEKVILASGIAFITNDMVNLISSFGAALISILMVIGGIHAS